MTNDEERHLLRCGAFEPDVRELRAARDTPAMRAVADFQKSARRVQVLHGDPGTGKTLAALRWLLNAKQWFDDGNGVEWRWDVYSSAFVTAPRIFGLNRKFGPDRAEFERLCRVRWLVLDDLGTEKDTDLADEFFNERCGRGGRTVITTNMLCPTLKRPECVFAERYKPRVISRMAQNGIYSFTGTTDLRKGVSR